MLVAFAVLYRTLRSCRRWKDSEINQPFLKEIEQVGYRPPVALLAPSHCISQSRSPPPPSVFTVLRLVAGFGAEDNHALLGERGHQYAAGR